MRTKALFVAMLLELAPLHSVAEDFDVWLAAYQSGYYATTLESGSRWLSRVKPAQSNLGVMYEQGQGVLQDYAEAVRWYGLAADQANSPAQNNLGVMYTNGQGVAQNYALAHIWANIAAANGSEKAVGARGILDRMMTSTDIAEEQRRASVCMESNYQDCK